MRTKADVLQWADLHGVEVSHTTPTIMDPIHHVHADIISGRQVFRGHDLHNLGLWDDTLSPDWRAVGAELLRADIGPCENPDCDYCREDEE